METIAVRFRDCRCPGSPHPDGDVAQLRPYLDFDGGAEALASVLIYDDDGNVSFAPPVEWSQRLGPIYLRRGIEAWNLLDEDGEPVPVTEETVKALRYEEAYEIADRADDIYGGQVLAPLVKRMSMSSKATRTNGSTPHPRRTSPKPRTPSGSSS